MFKKALLIVFLLLLAPAVLHAQKAIRVGVAPFAVFSQEDLSYLSQGLQEMLGNSLLQRGVEIGSQAEILKTMAGRSLTKLDEQSAREIGRALNLDYVVFGSLTKVGRSISLDARIVDTLGMKKTVAVFLQGEGIENLAATTDRLARDMIVKISGRQKIVQIAIAGNQRIEADAIKGVLQTQEGDLFSESKISADLKRVYAMNFFDDVKVDVEDREDGKIVKFIVEEKPSIQSILFDGNQMVEQQDLLGVLGYNVYSIVDPKKLLDSVNNMKNYYREKGYYNAKIEYKVEDIGPKKVSVRYDIDEGSRIYVSLIDFQGNKAFSDDDLRDEMETSEKGWFSWLLDSGILKQDKIKNDLSKLEAFYYNHGYIKARIGDPDVKLVDDGLVVTIPIEEGPQYKVGQVTISGDMTVPEETVREAIKINKEDYFNRDILRKDVQAITGLYADQGYAFAAVTPMAKQNDADLTVDIDYKIEKKGLVYFERISIAGNTKTRDKVIRRELKVREGDLFSAEDLRKSNMNLQRLGYFEEVSIVNTPGSAEDKMNLKVEVKERPTGAFAVGAGYSSFNSFFATASVSQNNLFGTGQKLKVQGTFGGRSTEYEVSWTEPWLYDMPLAVGADIFNRQVDYTDYDKESSGLVFRAGYPVWEYTRLSGRYMFEDITVTNVTEDASQQIKEIEGDSSTSSLRVMIDRDTRNRYFNPTEGSENSLSVEYAGGFLGGTNYFTRYVLDSGWYFPLPMEEHSIFVRGKFGYVAKREGGNLPAYEKFYLGGINSVRGFEWSDISPKDPVTGTSIGGEKMVLFNLEYLFPVVKEAGLVGVVFVDQGNVWREEDEANLGDLRMSYGAGIRWFSPLGPLRLEWGKVVNPREGEPSSNWEFSVGTFF